MRCSCPYFEGYKQHFLPPNDIFYQEVIKKTEIYSVIYLVFIIFGDNLVNLKKQNKMTENTHTSSLVSKVYTIETTPEYFGAYLNIARHNIFMISQEMSRKFNKKVPKLDDGKIGESFLIKDFAPTDSGNFIYQNLCRYLPLANAFSSDFRRSIEMEDDATGMDIVKLSSFLKIAFEELRVFRNDYTHYFSKATDTKRKVLVENKLAIQLKVLFEVAVKLAKKRFQDVIKDTCFDTVENSIKSELFVGKTNQITTKGLTFFCCLFLDKENAFHFINKISGLKKTGTADFKATREVFSVLCVKLPHNKLDSRDYQQALLMDALNYLQRAPNELYNALNENDQKKFKPTLNDKYDDEDYESYLKDISTLKRSWDRFPEFALNFLDASENFKYDFQIHLGKVETKSYSKRVLGKMPEEKNRSIVKDVKTFGKLSTYTDDVQQKIIKEKDFIKLFKGTEVKFIQYAPHYNIVGNKIALAFSDQEIFFNKESPQAFLSITELPKVVLLELLSSGAASRLIKIFLDKNEHCLLNRQWIDKIKEQLPNFSLLKRISTDSKDYEEYRANFHKRKLYLDKLLKAKGLDCRQIPSRIIDYCLNVEDTENNYSFKERIKKAASDCKKRIKDIEKGRQLKVGEMASELARDIIKLVIDRDVKTKITSFYYDLLQECLALYANNEKKQLFWDLCKRDLNLLDKDKGHPFLADLESKKINSTLDLYKAYLLLKKDWLHNTFYSTTWNKNKKKDETKIRMTKIGVPYTYQKWIKPDQDFDSWLNSVQPPCPIPPKKIGKPVNLPTNLFDSALITRLKKEVTISDDKETYNYSRLLGMWRKDLQPFYQQKRHYTIFKDRPYESVVTVDPKEDRSVKSYYESILDDVIEQCEEEKELISEAQLKVIFKKAVAEKEKKIRYYCTEDRILMKMINHVFQEISTINPESDIPKFTISLNDIYPNSENNPLEEKEDMEVRLYDKTIVAHRKRKDYSFFIRFLHDERMKNLLPYFKEEKIDFDKLVAEIKDYEKSREVVFSKSFELEKAILSVISPVGLVTLFNEGTKDGPNVQYKAYLNRLKENKFIDQDDYNLLSVIRNKFCHNDFPYLDEIKLIPSFNVSIYNFSQQIASWYEQKIDLILKDLSKIDNNYLQ